MSLLMELGDYVPNGAGSVTAVTGGQAVLSEALFRLTARRGAFPLLPAMGSRMHLLRREKPSRREALARQYAAEALEDMEGVTVTGVSVSVSGGRLLLQVELLWQGETLDVEWEGSF